MIPSYPDQPPLLWVGLGNPGQSYAETRHNAGVWALEAWLASHGAMLKPAKIAKARTTTLNAQAHRLHALVPSVFMNLSGRPVGRYLRYHRIPVSRVLVIHDELDLPVGQVRLKFDGGFGGHNGLKDIGQHLGSRAFWRLRIGIGHPGHADAVSAYVLNRPSVVECAAIDQAIGQGLEAIPMMLQDPPGWDAAFRHLHRSPGE